MDLDTAQSELSEARALLATREQELAARTLELEASGSAEIEQANARRLAAVGAKNDARREVERLEPIVDDLERARQQAWREKHLEASRPAPYLERIDANVKEISACERRKAELWKENAALVAQQRQAASYCGEEGLPLNQADLQFAIQEALISGRELDWRSFVNQILQEVGQPHLMVQRMGGVDAKALVMRYVYEGKWAFLARVDPPREAVSMPRPDDLRANAERELMREYESAVATAKAGGNQAVDADRVARLEYVLRNESMREAAIASLMQEMAPPPAVEAQPEAEATL